MDALGYEYLIRRAHYCGRYGVHGADADTYRSYEREESRYMSAKAAKLKNKIVK